MTAPTALDLPLLLLPTAFALTPSNPAVYLVVLLVVPEQPPDAVAPHQRQPSEQREQVAEATVAVLWSSVSSRADHRLRQLQVQGHATTDYT